MVSPLSRVPVVTSDAALELVRRLLAEAGLEAAKVSLKAVTQGKAVRRVTSEAERVVVPGLGKVLRRLKQQQPPRLVIFARDVDGGERVASLVQQLLAESERTRARVIVAGTRAQLGAWTCRSTRNPSAPMDGGQAKAAHSCVAVCQCKALQGKVTDLFRMAETEKIAIASGISVRSEEMGAGVGGPASLSPIGPAQVVEFTSNGERRVRGATGEWKVVQPARPGGRVFGDDIIVSR